MASTTVERPIDLVRLSLDERVLVKCKGNRELRGKLHAFDEHMNVVLGDVEEQQTVREEDAETGEVLVRTTSRRMPMLFVRGDIIILIAPPARV